MKYKRIFLIVLDSLGIGCLPDAENYGDVGANTLQSISKSKKFHTPNLAKLGLFNIDGVACGQRVANPTAIYGRCSEQSAGKDTTIGHWEIAGLISCNPLPTYPNGFPKEVIEKFEKLTGFKVICNKPYSGTEVIAKYGQEHIKTGALIVYTSADSVFQVAAHEQHFGLQKLYDVCQIARDMLVLEHGVGRVIARPFVGEEGNFVRTANRHDYSLTPKKPTLLNILSNNGLDVISIGKINDIFAGSGITKALRSKSNSEGMAATLSLADEDFTGLCFTNLVDFDMLFGHRNDIDGYANALSEFDLWLEVFLQKKKNTDLLIITADHGCDPGYTGTDHSREYTPLIVYGAKEGVNLGTRNSFADIGKTIVDIFGLYNPLDGECFIGYINK